MIKVTTQSGTQYLIEFENARAMRICNTDNVWTDDETWFDFAHVHAYDRETQTHIYEEPYIVGKSLFFDLVGFPRDYDWKLSTDVVSVEEM
jgi:hypothetical protein